MKGYRRISFLFLICASISITVMAGNDDPRYSLWPSYMNKMREDIVNGRTKNTLDDVNRFMKAAEKSQIKDCLSYAYYYKVFFFTVVSPDVKEAEASVHFMERQKMNEVDINKAKFDIIYYYQLKGLTVKAVALCRSILNTTHDKSSIAEANYNILLLYQALGMYERAASKAIEMCRFSESITEKKIYHYSLANFYSCVADFLVEAGHYKEALPYLEKCDSTLNHDGMNAPSAGGNDMRFVTVTWGKYYVGIGDDKNVWHQVEKIRGYNDGPLLAYSYEIEAKYYYKHQDYAKAQIAMDTMLAILKRLGMSYCDAKRTLMRAKIASNLGDFKSACVLYAQFISENDSLNRQADELRTNEYAVQLSLNKADLEKSEYKARANHYRVQLMTVITIVVLLVLIISVFIILYLRRINHKLHQVNYELQKAYDRVDKLSKMKSIFFQNMSHEIRTPLNSIIGFSQLIGEDSKEYKQYSDIIVDNGFQLSKIVDNVLEMSDLESSEIDIRPTDVDDCCKEVISRVSTRFSDNLKMVYEPSAKELVIHGNSHLLELVLFNLLDNSLKFTKEGQITLGYFVEDSDLHLYVKDTGSGIPEDKSKWVFERFTKLNEFAVGSGLGLSLCQLIVEKFNGRISIDNTYHDGCKVDVWLPL
jgi:signal transduction histidine kinase